MAGDKHVCALAAISARSRLDCVTALVAFANMRKLHGDPTKLANPFRPVVPDSADPDVILGLFETVDTFDRLRWKGHHVVVGPRGSGKSMILRRLCASVKAKASEQENPEYFGVYVLIRNGHAEMFRRAFRETDDTRPFQHFLTCYLVAQVAAEICLHPLAHLVDSDVTKIILTNCACLGNVASPNLATVKSALDWQWQEASRIADGVRPLRTDFVQSSRVPDIMVEVAKVLRKATPEQGGVGLLIDSYGYLKELAGFVNEWMRKDLVDSLSIKASGVTSHEAIRSTLIESRPEPDHDYEIVPHQFDPVSKECVQVFRAIANRRLARAGITVSLEDLLPANLEPQDKSKLKFISPQPRPLEYLAALSGGDVGAFIRVLELIWGCVKKNDGRYPVPVQDFGRCCRKSSDTYWKETIPVQARDEWRELQSLTRAAATHASGLSSGSSSPSGVIIGFELQNPSGIEPQLKRVIQSGLRLGILQCDADERAAMEVDSEYCPSMVELNRRLCAYSDFELDPRGCAHTMVTPGELLNWVQTAYHGQDDKASGGAQSRSGFSWANCVFVSCPLPSESHRRPDHQSRLITGLFNALVAMDQSSGRLSTKPERKELVRDPLDLRVDDFVREIPEAIKDCRFVVHDVTELSPGVAFELGLALGYGKIRALVWDDARRPFDAGQLPVLLATRLHVNHFPFKQEPGFKSWLDDKLVRPCLHKLCDPQPPAPARQSESIFTYVGNQYTDLRTALDTHLTGLREPNISDDEHHENRRFLRFEAMIRAATAAVINYDDHDLLSAVLLGVAAGAETPTLMTYDGGSSRRLTMWGDRPFIEWRPKTLANDLVLQEFPGQLRQLLSKGSCATH